MFILAIVDDGVIYAYHDKIYTKRKMAENALKAKIKSGKLTSHYQVCEIDRVFLK